MAQTLIAAEKEKEKLEKKKGWSGCLLILGILILIAGLGTFIAARKSAGDLIQTNYENQGVEGVAADDALAKAAGHDSYSDYITEQNRKSGMFFAAVGIVLIVVGYRTFSGNKTPHS